MSDPTASPRRLVRRVLLVTTTSALLAGAVAVAGDAAAAPTAPTPSSAAARVQTSTAPAAAQKAASDYWTPQRLASARSADVASTSAKTAPAATGAVAKPDGPLGRAAGTPPARTAATPGATPAATPGAAPGAAAAAAGATYVPVYSSQYATYPYSANGKVFFTAGGGNWVCSGTSVTAFYNGVQQSEVWTAGHCLANLEATHPNTWSSNVLFIPGYNGTASTYAAREPFGRFASTGATVATNWLTKGDPSVDLGSFKVGTSNTGRILYQAVGAAGFMWNANPNQTFDMFGYPQASPYSGNSMYHYRGTTSARYTWPGGSGQPMTGVPNPMTGGSSGGAWYVGWSANGTGWINGHNDWKFDSSTMYSPYFDGLANTVRCSGLSSC